MNNKQLSNVENTSSKFTLAPKLRFPEFRDRGEWGCALGNAVFDQVSNKDHKSDLPILAVTQEHGAIPRDMIDYNVSVTDKSIESYKVVEIGDFIISLRSFQGGIEFSQFHGICSPAYVILRLKPAYSKEYFKNYLKTKRFIVKMTKNLEGLRDGKMISYKHFSELKLPIPEPEEQQKIADFLASLDERIRLQSNKLKTLRAYKKGMLKQLFPVEGETLPKLRFPEFLEAGEWEEIQLSQLGELVSGLTYSPEDVRDAGLLVLRSSNVQDGRITLDDKVYVRNDIKGANPTRDDDILICVRNGSKSLIGKSALIPERMPPCTHGAFMTIFRAKSAKFIFQLFQTEAYAKQVSADLGATINSINGNQLKKYTFLSKPPEQKKIADVLASLDAIIDAQSQMVDSLKTYKNGLMQQLFPKMDEVKE